MSTTNTCANCGKGEESAGGLKSCTACKLVKYCNRDCQVAHRPQHKKKCKKRAAELFDEQLFKEPPPREECPICFLLLPLNTDESFYKSCCGKEICNGCIVAMTESGAKDLCPFCKTPNTISEEVEVSRVKKLMEKGNGRAYYQLAGYYKLGIHGLPQNTAKANELLLKAGELSCVDAYHNLGVHYYNGDGVAIDKKKAKHYYELAAMNGDVEARHNLGCMEGQTGNHKQAMKHLMISASAGLKESLDGIKNGYVKGRVTKEQYTNALREYQKSQDEMKSDARDKAHAYDLQEDELLAS